MRIIVLELLVMSKSFGIDSGFSTLNECHSPSTIVLESKKGVGVVSITPFI